MVNVLPPLRGLESFRFATRGRRAWRRSDPGLYAATPSGGRFGSSADWSSVTPPCLTHPGRNPTVLTREVPTESTHIRIYDHKVLSQSHRADQGSSDCNRCVQTIFCPS